MDEREEMYAEARNAIEKASGLLPGALGRGELVSFMGDEEYAHDAYAQMTVEQLIDVVWSVKPAA